MIRHNQVGVTNRDDAHSFDASYDLGTSGRESRREFRKEPQETRRESLESTDFIDNSFLPGEKLICAHLRRHPAYIITAIGISVIENICHRLNNFLYFLILIYDLINSVRFSLQFTLLISFINRPRDEFTSGTQSGRLLTCDLTHITLRDHFGISLSLFLFLSRTHFDGDRASSPQQVGIVLSVVTLTLN
ncbi:hypothetical protein PUN28_013167 [Cardiocondyla obscurior]|uniref:Uncharacterized protein n=1 Tax=Cardiocondyla obscurior TaxID=286306 RepID=A0AAW2FAM2_9HYME